MKARLSTAEAAEILGVPEQFLRIALQQGKYPFGFVVKTSNRYTYYINGPQLEEYMRSKSA